MKHKNVIATLLILGMFFILGAANQVQAYNEARVRYILVDISLGGSIAYYRDFPENPNAVEALRRWESGVRVTNLNQFERGVEDGGPGIVYAGTCDVIDGMDVDLNTDYTNYYQAPRMQYVFPEFNFFGVFHNYRGHHANVAQRHWGDHHNPPRPQPPVGPQRPGPNHDQPPVKPGSNHDQKPVRGERTNPYPDRP